MDAAERREAARERLRTKAAEQSKQKAVAQAVAVKEQKVTLRKVEGKKNPSDLMTKGLSIIDIEKMLGLMNGHFRTVIS